MLPLGATADGALPEAPPARLPLARLPDGGGRPALLGGLVPTPGPEARLPGRLPGAVAPPVTSGAPVDSAAPDSPGAPVVPRDRLDGAVAPPGSAPLASGASEYPLSRSMMPFSESSGATTRSSVGAGRGKLMGAGVSNAATTGVDMGLAGRAMPATL
jgi:hypothetical protein